MPRESRPCGRSCPNRRARRNSVELGRGTAWRARLRRDPRPDADESGRVESGRETARERSSDPTTRSRAPLRRRHGPLSRKQDQPRAVTWITHCKADSAPIGGGRCGLHHAPAPTPELCILRAQRIADRSRRAHRSAGRLAVDLLPAVDAHAPDGSSSSGSPSGIAQAWPIFAGDGVG